MTFTQENKRAMAIAPLPLSAGLVVGQDSEA